jgi:hypothetical protein
MRFLGLLLVIVVLAGCTAAEPEPPRAVHNPTETTVRVDDADLLVGEALARYVDITNEILAGQRPTTDIETISTPEWATEELAGFATVAALSADAPVVELSRWQVSTVRGHHTLVDALVAACLGADGSFTRVTVRLVPQRSELVIAEIVPAQDSTWCLV